MPVANLSFSHYPFGGIIHTIPGSAVTYARIVVNKGRVTQERREGQ
jgi:hypothetical protein